MNVGDKAIFPRRKISSGGKTLYDTRWTVSEIQDDIFTLTNRRGRTIKVRKTAIGFREPTPAELVKYRKSW